LESAFSPLVGHFAPLQITPDECAQIGNGSVPHKKVSITQFNPPRSNGSKLELYARLPWTNRATLLSFAPGKSSNRRKPGLIRRPSPIAADRARLSLVRRTTAEDQIAQFSHSHYVSFAQ
jgi:hypothetical protein